jgi:hypothetical protein
MVFSLQRMIEGRRVRLEPGFVEQHSECAREVWSILKPRENLCWSFSLVMLLSTGVVTWLMLAESISDF